MKSIVKKIVGKNPFAVLALCIVFFVASGCNDPNVIFPENDDCIPELGWSVKFKLKQQEDENYIATEDPGIIALILEHDVIFRQIYTGSKTTPELLLYYSLTGKECNSENKKKIINNFLATDKFEDEVYEYGYAHTLNIKYYE